MKIENKGAKKKNEKSKEIWEEIKKDCEVKKNKWKEKKKENRMI